jgi:hypothetical protein
MLLCSGHLVLASRRYFIYHMLPLPLGLFRFMKCFVMDYTRHRGLGWGNLPLIPVSHLTFTFVLKWVH